MKKLLLLLFLIPNLVMGGGMGGSKESAPGKNPFEILKEVIENNNNSKGGGYDTNKPKETAQTKETTKLIFPSDIEGAEEIYENPKLKRLEIYGDTKLQYLKNGEYLSSSDFLSDFYHTSPNSVIFDIEKSCSSTEPVTRGCAVKTWSGWADKCYSYETGGGYDPDAEKSIVKALEQPSQSAEDYKTNTSYRFITKLDKKIIFAKDSEQLDHKLYPKLNGLGELTINLDASYTAKKYYETALYVTFIATAYDSCVKRSIDNYWYDPNELKLVKEEPETKIQNTEENKITPVDDIAITFDEINDSYYDGYNLHERMIASSLNNSEIKIYCSSCTEQKEYSVKVDIDSYKKKHAENVKKQEKIKFDQSVAPLKSQCEEIGFIPGTNKFKNCLVEMIN